MVLLYQDVAELAAIAQQNGEILCRETDFEIEQRMPRSIGEGGLRHTFLRNGMYLGVLNGRLWQPIQSERQYKTEAPLTAKFHLSGACRVQTKDPALTNAEADCAEISGCHYVHHLPETTDIEHWPSSEWCKAIMVAAPVDYFRSFSQSGPPLAPALKRLLDGDKRQRFHQSLGPMSPAMTQVLQQILQSPYQGMMQQLYLESKVLELLTLQFTQWSEVPPATKSHRLLTDELDRLHAARELLIHDVQKPPTLAELAQQVGLNEYRLKQGFRQVFGTTVFGCLHHCRMQQAQHLLRNSNLTIAGVAAQVGYLSPEAFSTAFRRKFTVSPKAYQLGKHP